MTGTRSVSRAGYVVKGARQDEILRAIRAVAAGEAIFGPSVANHISAIFGTLQVADRAKAIIGARDAGLR